MVWAFGIYMLGILYLLRLGVDDTMNFKDLSGQQFNHLTVIRDSGERDTHKAILWECKCVCGKTTLVRGNDLKYNKIKSCGCKRSKEQSKAGKKHVDSILETMVEGTNLAVLNNKLPKNNKSGIKGVFWVTSKQKWKATITFQNKAYYLGMFDDINKAAEARKEAEEKFFNPVLEKYGKDPL